MKKKFKLTESSLRNTIHKVIKESMIDADVEGEILSKFEQIRDIALSIKGLAEENGIDDVLDAADDISFNSQMMLDSFGTDRSIEEIANKVINKIINEDGIGGGATSCSPAGGDSVGQYEVPFGGVQRKNSFYSPTSKRSKDFKNGSMTMRKEDEETNSEINKK